jgi:hypothetical protein
MDMDYFFSEPTLPPELRAFREKLKEHQFSENIEWILNTPVLLPARSFTDSKGLAPALITSLKIKVIEDQRNIHYKPEQLLQLVVCDKHSGTFDEAVDKTSFNVMYVIHNGKCVMDVMIHYGMNGRRRNYRVKHICELTVHRFLDGKWVTDLAKLTDFLQKQRYKNS